MSDAEVLEVDLTKKLSEICFDGLDLLSAVISQTPYNDLEGTCLVQPVDFGIAGAMLMRPWNPQALPNAGESIFLNYGKLCSFAIVEKRIVGERWSALVLQAEVRAMDSIDQLIKQLDFYARDGWMAPWIGGRLLCEACDELRAVNEMLEANHLMPLFSLSQVGFGPTPTKEEKPEGYDDFKWGSPPPSFAQFRYAYHCGVAFEDGMTKRSLWVRTQQIKNGAFAEGS